MRDYYIKSSFHKIAFAIIISLILGLVIPVGYSNIYPNETNLISIIKTDSSDFCSKSFSINADEPNITATHNFWYIEGITGNSITWNITDFTVNNPTYFVERNSIVIVTNRTWISGENITLNVDGLTPNLYNYTIVYTDGFGEIYTNTILVNVVANADPIISSPDDITFPEGNPSISSIYWTVSDITYTNLTFEIFQNESSTGINDASSGSFSLNVAIYYLTEGSYNYTLYVEDGLGGSNSDTVWVFILQNNDTSNPTTITVINSFTNGILSLSLLVSVSITTIVICKRRK